MSWLRRITRRTSNARVRLQHGPLVFWSIFIALAHCSQRANATDGVGASQELRRKMPGDLKLTKGESSSYRSFSIVCEAVTPKIDPCLLIMQVTDGKVAAIVMTMDGRPMLYFNNNESIEVANSGSLICRHNVGFTYHMTSSDGQLDFTFGLVPSAQATIDSDPKGIIEGALKHAVAVKQAAAETYSIVTKGGRYAVQVLSIAQEHPLDRFALTMHFGDDYHFRETATSAPIPAAASIPIITAEQLRATDIPVSAVELPVATSPWVPSILGNSREMLEDKANDRASAFLGSLLPVKAIICGMLAGHADQVSSCALYAIDPPDQAVGKKILQSYSVHKKSEAVLLASAISGHSTMMEFRNSMLRMTDATSDLADILPVDKFAKYAIGFLNTETTLDTFQTQRWHRFLANVISSSQAKGVTGDALRKIILSCMNRAIEMQITGQTYLAGEISKDDYLRQFGSEEVQQKLLFAELAGSLEQHDLLAMQAAAKEISIDKLDTQP